MGFGKRLRSRGIVPQVKIDRMLPAVRCRHLGDNAVGIPDLHTPRRHPDDRALRDRCDGVAAPDIDIMGMTIGAVDQQIVAVTVLIGEAAGEAATADTSGEARLGQRVARTVKTRWLTDHIQKKTNIIISIKHYA